MFICLSVFDIAHAMSFWPMIWPLSWPSCPLEKPFQPLSMLAFSLGNFVSALEPRFCFLASVWSGPVPEYSRQELRSHQKESWVVFSTYARGPHLVRSEWPSHTGKRTTSYKVTGASLVWNFRMQISGQLTSGWVLAVHPSFLSPLSKLGIDSIEAHTQLDVLSFVLKTHQTGFYTSSNPSLPCCGESKLGRESKTRFDVFCSQKKQELQAKSKHGQSKFLVNSKSSKNPCWFLPC